MATLISDLRIIDTKSLAPQMTTI